MLFRSSPVYSSAGWFSVISLLDSLLAIMVQYLPVESVSSIGMPVPLIRGLFDDVEPEAIFLDHTVGGDELEYSFSIWCCLTLAACGWPCNRALMRYLGNPGSGHSWSGMVVVLKFSSSQCRTFTNIERSDLPPVIQYLGTR